MGFKATDQAFPASEVREEIIKNYKEQRDIPSIAGTSRLSVHLRLWAPFRFGNWLSRHKVLAKGF